MSLIANSVNPVEMLYLWHFIRVFTLCTHLGVISIQWVKIAF